MKTLTLILGVALGLGGPEMTVASEQVDLIVHNGVIHSMDTADEPAQAVAVSGERILALGSNQDILALAGPDTRQIDAGGKTVIPGLIDTHIHLDEVGANIQKIQTNDLTELKQLLERISEAADGLPDGDWIVGATDWHESQLLERRFPTRKELDAAAPHNPVFLQRGGINAVINSAAMDIAGIGEQDPDPAGGKYDRGVDGRFSGWIQSFGKVKEIAGLLPQADEAQLREQLRVAMTALGNKGVTTVRSQHVSPELVKVWRAMAQEEQPGLRGVLMMEISPRAPLQSDIAMLLENGLEQDQGNDMLRIGGLKVTYDGGVETSLLKTDFANIPGFKGIEVTPLTKIRALSEYACANGWRLSVHAIGDQAIANVLQVWSELDQDCPIAGLRWGLEHPYLPSLADIGLMKQLGVVPHTQAPHNYTLGAGWVEFWGEQRANSSIPNRSYIDAGLHPAGGSDSPVAPYDPFLAMWVEVTRQTAAAGILGATEAVTPLEALKMHTIWAAYGLGMEDNIGSLTAGKYADMVILSDDPLMVEPEKIRDISAEWTILSGKVIHHP